jgi:glycosyltransferase involved in cell wall biosynthesis
VPGDPLPRLDLVVATVERTEPLDALLGALDAQSHRDFRLLVVDQNDDDRVARTLARHTSLSVLHLRSTRGLSLARNVALAHIEAPLVAFPDDDCLYPPELLARVAGRFAADERLDALCGRAASADGAASGRWPTHAATVTQDAVWHTAISHTIFVRRELVLRVGRFDEELGLGSGTPWSSGEEIDYLVRALRAGARIEYDPSFVVTHPVKPVSTAELVALGHRDGASVGYVLAANAYPARAIARMLARPALGALTSLALLDTTRARFHAATLAGRLRGLRSGRGRQLSS